MIGIERHGNGYRASVSQGRGRPKIRRWFPLTATEAEMQAWRLDTQAQCRVDRKHRPAKGTFAGDARRYLNSVSALTTYQERAKHIALWVQVFGTTPRERITPAAIRQQRDRWLLEPRAPGQPPLHPHTVNLRVRALANLWTVLDGKRAYNPVRDVEPAHEPQPRPRDLDYATIRRILDALPDLGRAEKGKPRGNISLTKIRLRILAYTGIPPAQLMKLTPEDIDFDAGTMRLPSRRKGRGTERAQLPLLPPALAAFRDLKAHQGFGPFRTGSVWASFQRAATAAGITQHVRPYDLRHSFLTVVYDVTGSLEIVMAFAQHVDSSMARRYTARAALRLLTQATAKLRDSFPA